MSFVLAAAYFTLSGTTVTLVANKNVASVVRNSTGQYTITFTSTLSTANYMVLATARAAASYTEALECAPSRNTTSGKNAYSTSALDVVCYGPGDSPAVAEAERVCVLVIDPSTADADAAALWQDPGGSLTLLSALNATVTSPGTGLYTVAFTSALADANYSAFCGARYPNGAGEQTPISNGNRNPTGSNNLHTTSAFSNFCGNNNGAFGPSSVQYGGVFVRKASRSSAGVLAAVRFSVSGSTCTIIDQQNVTSVTYNSTGVYTVNFTSALANTNWVPICAGKWGDAAGNNNTPWVGAPGLSNATHTLTTSAVTVATRFFQNSGPFDAATIDVLIVDAGSFGGGSDYSDSVSESVSAADTDSALAVFASSLTETLSAADTEASVGVFSSAVAETASAADALATGGSFGVSVAENSNIADLVSGGTGIGVGVSEASPASDDFDTVRYLNLSVDESAPLLDITNGGFPYSEGVSEFSNLSDSLASVIYVKPYLCFRRAVPAPDGEGPGNPGVLYIAFTRDG